MTAVKVFIAAVSTAMVFVVAAVLAMVSLIATHLAAVSVAALLIALVAGYGRRRGAATTPAAPVSPPRYPARAHTPVSAWTRQARALPPRPAR